MNKRKVIIISIILVTIIVTTLILTRPNLRKLLGSINLMNLQAIDVPYTNNNQSNVKDAIDDLYTKVDSMECASGYTKGETTSNGGYECVLPPTPSISSSSWEDIISGYVAGNTSNLEEDMAAGTTRNVDLGDLGVHPVRIANLTPCSEVDVESKSSCGLVIEFADIITTHRMNPYNSSASVNGDGNKGGWEYSDMRAFLNGTTYARESIDYSETGIYSKLPLELKSKIINTTVISGSGSNDSDIIFTTIDKLYLLSSQELWNSNAIEDKANDSTRQLDYYFKKGVTSSANYSAAIKQNNGSDSRYWLRSAISNTSNFFLFVESNGTSNRYNSKSTYGVSPAFRLAE